jgi:hypothetical protein
MSDKASVLGASSAAAAGMPAGPSLLSAAIVKGLSDKLYDKRKNAALEIEKCVCVGHFQCFSPVFLTSLHRPGWSEALC